jgi:hypothetical protein
MVVTDNRGCEEEQYPEEIGKRAPMAGNGMLADPAVEFLVRVGVIL